MAAGAALAILPAAATAATVDTYVDDNAADNLTPCSLASPCQQIATAVGDTLVGGTVHVESGTYAGGIILDGGRSLIAQDFIPGPPNSRPLIDGGVGFGIGNNASASGTVSGFTIRGDGGAVSAAYGITVTGNVIDEGTPSGGFKASVEFVNGGFGTGNYVVTNNVLSDPTPTDEHIAVYADASAAQQVTISDNTFNGFREAIDAIGGAQMFVERNLITGIRQNSVPVQGFGIVVAETAATLVANRLQQPGVNPGVGISVLDLPGAPPTSAALARNRVFNFDQGVRIEDTEGAVTMNGDVFANNGSGGITTTDQATSNGNITATNVTVFGSNTDITLFDTAITLDSSIVGNAIGALAPASCTITNSRGPTTTPGPNGCGGFQTTAPPGFVDPSLGANNFHLAAGSAMIDQGNPVQPPPGTIDFDGDPRELDGDCNGTVRRDIGADELNRDCTPATTPILTPALPAVTTPAKKKCKKGRKLRRGKCVKKKKK